MDGSGTNEGGPVASDLAHLVEQHRFFVVQIAGEYARRGVPFEDLLAEGLVGLIEAAQRFDETHGVRFLTYAQWWIRKRMLDYVARESRVVRLTRYAREQRRSVVLARDALRQDLGREPTLEELARATDLDENTLARRLQGDPRVCSLDEPIDGAGGRSFGDSLASPDAASPAEALERAAMADEVRAAIGLLPRRERLVLESRFAIAGQEPQTYDDLGRTLGVSRERVRQIERDAICRLRRRLSARPIPGRSPRRPLGPPPG